MRHLKPWRWGAPPEKVFLWQGEWREKEAPTSDEGTVAGGSEAKQRGAVAGHCEGQVGVSTCWMNPVSVGEYHGLRVGAALLSIVAGCIIIGVSRECDADAVGGIFLGAGGLGEYLENIAGTYWSSLAGKFFDPFGFPRVTEWSQNVDVAIWT